MVEHGASHLVVVDPTTGHPAGILSTLDVAAAYAG
jgi:CBS domain-containing protein